MKRFLEFFQQQDGSFCILQTAIGGGFGLFWLVWGYISIKHGAVSDCPAGLAGLLVAMLAAKVWKDKVDFKDQSVQSQQSAQAAQAPVATTGFVTVNQ